MARSQRAEVPDQLLGYITALRADHNEPAHATTSTEHDPLAAVPDFRKQAMELQDLQRDKLDPYLQNLYEGQRPTGAPRRLRLSEWVAYDATDEQVVDVLARHTTVLEEQRADRGIQQRFTQLKNAYTERLYDFMDSGSISKSAVNKLPRIAAMRLQIGDIRETHLQWKAAQYFGPSNEMVIGQGTGRTREERSHQVAEALYESLPHEASHVFGRWLPHWAQEGFAEQLNLAVQGNEILAFNPRAQQPVQSRYYVAERQLLDTLFYHAPAGATAGRGAAQSLMLSATSRGPDSRESRSFEHSLDELWGVSDAFAAVDRRHRYIEEQVRARNHEWNDFQVATETASAVAYELQEVPERVFGAAYKKPQHYIGTAAVAGSIRR